MLHNWLDSISLAIQNSEYAAPVLALLAGLITSMTPCSLSTIPLVIGLTGQDEKTDAKRSFLLSLVFVLGTAITFVLLGLAASTLGSLVNMESKRWSILIGTIMCMMALQIWGVANFIPRKLLPKPGARQGYGGAFLTGMMGGIFSSPCATPVLLILLGIALKNGRILWGCLLLLLYSIGHGILILIAGTSSSFVRRLQDNRRYSRVTNLLNKIMGLLLLYIGLNMLFLRF